MTDTFYSSVKADFDLLTEGSEIILYANGDVHVVCIRGMGT